MNYKKIYLVEFHDIDLFKISCYNILRNSTNWGLTMKVCFLGHRTIEKREELAKSLTEIIELLINKGYTTFLFGSNSAFIDLSWEIVTKLKEKYPFINRVYVRSSYQYIDKSYENYLLQFYEKTYFPQKLENAGKLSYVERNYEIIDNSICCIFYYNENYVPTQKKRIKPNTIFNFSTTSGTKLAYEYAVKKKKQIINLYKQKD